MDIMEFDAASRTGVDDIREIIDSSQYAPILGRYKIYIIDEIHMLSKSAFNALLKTLEEPPQHVKFIFATTEIHKIPETILSRCMIFQLKPVSNSSLSEYLNSISEREGYILEQSARDTIAEESGGSVRDSLSILEQAIMLSPDDKRITSEVVISMLGGATNQEIEEVLLSILSADTKGALSKMEELISKGADPFVIYKSIQNSLYKLIVKSVNGEENPHNHHSIQNLLYLWQILLRQTENMNNAENPEHVLNAAVVILSITASLQNIGDLSIKDESPSSNGQVMDKILRKFDGIRVNEIE
jgi:DNA polymerase-3 subunit gamma/tau